MLINTNKSEIVQTLKMCLNKPEYIPVLEIIQSNLSVNTFVVFQKKIAIGNVMIKMQVYSLDNGDIEINIKEASIAGLGVFGAVRKKAGDLIISTLSKYEPKVKTWKNEKGNIQINIPYVYVKQLLITGEELLFEVVI